MLLSELRVPLLLGEVQRWAPAVLLLSCGAGLRYATWQGPVIFSEADICFLFSAPLPRDALVRPKLLRGLAAGTLLGAGLGALLFALLRGSLGDAGIPLLAACLASPAALGLLVAALGWCVECSAKRARKVLRYSPLIFPLAALLAILPEARLGWVALLSGPWGWAVVPVLAATGGGAPLWPLLGALLVASALLAATGALAQAGEIPLEELSRRSELRSGLTLSFYSMDLRGAALQSRETQSSPARLYRRLLRRPRSPLLAVPWRGGLALSRSPSRMAWAAVLGGGGMLAALSEPTNILVALGAVLALYLAAARLVEPMRVEVDSPEASRRLPYRHGNLMLLHTIVPVTLLTFVAALACVAGVVLGVIPAGALLVALCACPLAASMSVVCAAAAAQRGQAPVELLAMGDTGAGIILMWLAAGPALALLTLGIPALVLVGALQSPGITSGTLAGVAAFVLAEVFVGLVTIKTRKLPGRRWFMKSLGYKDPSGA